MRLGSTVPENVVPVHDLYLFSYIYRQRRQIWQNCMRIWTINPYSA